MRQETADYFERLHKRRVEAAAEHPPLGITNIDAPSQEALAMYLIGLWFARDGARHLARRLRDHDGHDPEVCSVNVHELHRFVRHTPFLLEWLGCVEGHIWGGTTEAVQDLYRQLRTYLRNSLRPVDAPVTIEGRGDR